MKRFLLLISLFTGVVFAAAPVIWNNGEYAKWLTSLGFIFDDGKEMRTITVDPSAGAGVAAEIGSIALQDDTGIGRAWFKLGAADTAWTDILTSGSGWSLFGNSGTTAGTNFIGTTDSVDFVIKTGNTERFRISSTGAYDTTLGTGLVHSDSSGVLSSSLLVNADVDAAAAIDRSKLANGTAHQVVVNDASGVLNGIGPLTNGQLVIGSTGNASVAAGLTGTANQISVTNGAGSITLATPQDIATTSTPTFGGLTLTGESGAAYFSTGVLDSEAQLSKSRGGTGLDTSGVTNGQLLIGGTTSNDFQLGTLTGTANQISVTNGTNSITLATPQDIATSSSPTFTGMTLSGLSDGLVRSATGVLSGAGTVSLTTEVTGVLPLANGGTNKNMTASNGALVYSDADSLELLTACSDGQSIIWASGVPTCAGANGDVVGPASSVSGNLPSFADTTGKLLQDSGIAAADVVEGPASAVADNVALFDGTSGKAIKDSGYSIESGTYTPSPTGVTNVDSTSCDNSSYTRIGKIVTVTINCNIDATLGAGEVTEVRIPLPIAKGSNFSDQYEAQGSGGRVRSATTAAWNSFVIYADVGTQNLLLRMNSSGSTAYRYMGTAMYEID